MLLSAAERNSKVTTVVNFIPSKFWSLPQGILKVVLLHSPIWFSLQLLLNYVTSAISKAHALLMDWDKWEP